MSVPNPSRPFEHTEWRAITDDHACPTQLCTIATDSPMIRPEPRMRSTDASEATQPRAVALRARGRLMPVATSRSATTDNSAPESGSLT